MAAEVTGRNQILILTDFKSKVTALTPKQSGIREYMYVYETYFYINFHLLKFFLFPLNTILKRQSKTIKGLVPLRPGEKIRKFESPNLFIV